MYREDRAKQLAHLFQKQNGKCHICGELATMEAGRSDSAIRFRLGSGYGRKGRVRRRVMVHRHCAQERSDQIQDSVLVEERRARSGRHQSETWELAVACGEK